MLKISLRAALWLLIACVAAHAGNFGKISGVVTDAQTGEVLPGANVYIEELKQGAATDIEGYFVILQVPPGTYDLQVDYVGYVSKTIADVRVRSNRISVVDIQLSSGVLESEAVTVVAERPLVEKDISATTRSLSSEEMELVPANSVNEVLAIQPGVVNSGGLHFRGGRSGEVVYYVDGVPMVNPLFSEINSTEIINKDIISEMQVISGTYSAEYGNAMSGIINITSKEGRGEFGFDVDVRSTAVGFEEASTDYNRTIVRSNFSGSLFDPDLGFFVSGSFDDRDTYLPWGYNTQYNVFGKITSRHMNNIKLSVSGNISDRQRKSYRHSFKYIEEQYFPEPRTNSRMVNFSMTHTLSDNMYYTATAYANLFHYDSGEYGPDDLTPAYTLDNNKEFYTSATVSSFEETDQLTFGIKADGLWQANNYNEIKAGVEIRQHYLDEYLIVSPYYDDHTLDDYGVEPYEFSAYIQDKINFSNILLSAGLRFDLTNPNTDFWESPYDAFQNNTENFKSAETHTQLSPRLGISYPVSEKTVFHFGYGHYFQRPEYQFIYKALSDNNYDQNIVMNLRAGSGRFGNPNLKPEKTVAYEFGLSHQFMEDYLVNVSVYSKKITNLTGARTFFAGDVSRDGVPYWETWTALVNEDFAYNNGLELQIKKSRGKNLFGELSYTYSVAEGSSSGPLERVGSEEANRQSLKFFPLDFDQRHTINGYLSYRFLENEGPKVGGFALLENIRTTLLFQYGSGLPYTKGTRSIVEPYEVNNRRLPEYWTIDLKLDRKFKMDAFDLTGYLEVFNLTDRENVLYVDPFTGQPDYIEGRTRDWANNPLNYGSPRLIYLGFRFDY